GHDDVLRSLGADLRLGDARRVDALADDRDGLVELLRFHLLPVGQLGSQDDLGAALEVEGELGHHGRVAEDDTRDEGTEQHDDDRTEPTQRTPGFFDRGRLCHLRTQLSTSVPTPHKTWAHRKWGQSSLLAPGFLATSSIRSPNSGSVRGMAWSSFSSGSVDASTSGS